MATPCRPVAPGTVQATANRVQADHGTIREWYVNGPLGLQQGFTLPRQPAGGDGQKPLVVELGLGGDLQATVNAAGDGLSLTRPDGSVALSYGGLRVTDATGKALAAWLAVPSAGGSRELQIAVADAGAQYPLTIDPFVQQAKLTASDGALGDELGYSVAISGSTVVVGAQLANSARGAAYVFVAPTGGWASMTQTAKLTASDGASGNELGYSMAISGSTVVAGAPLVNSHTGVAYVFSGPALNVGTNTLNLGTTTAGTAGASQTFTVSGSNLDGSVLITAPSGVEVSSDNGSSYHASVILGSYPILARISATASAGSISGSISITSLNAPEQDISVSGSVSSQPGGSVSVTQIDDGLSMQRSMVRSLTLTFTSSITQTQLTSTVQPSLVLTRISDNLQVGLTGTLSNGGTVLTLKFTGSSILGGSLADGRYTLSYFGTPVSNGTFWRLFGDLAGSGQVDSSDQTAFTKAYNTRKGVTSTNGKAYNPYFDYTQNGFITIDSQTAFNQRYG